MHACRVSALDNGQLVLSYLSLLLIADVVIEKTLE